MNVTRTRALLLGMVLYLPAPAFPCSRDSPISITDIVENADAIVRAVAAEYTVPPASRKMAIAGMPDSRIRFKILEVVRSSGTGPEVTLPGYLVNHDDFNDHRPPYKFVRPNGLAGSCFANQYRAGAQFLLFLKKLPAGGYTANWYALGPVNEQLRSEKDAWLLWVREHAAQGHPRVVVERGRVGDVAIGAEAGAIYNKFGDRTKLIDLKLEGMLSPALAIRQFGSQPAPGIIAEIEPVESRLIVTRIHVLDPALRTREGIGGFAPMSTRFPQRSAKSDASVVMTKRSPLSDDGYRNWTTSSS